MNTSENVPFPNIFTIQYSCLNVPKAILQLIKLRKKIKSS